MHISSFSDVSIVDFVQANAELAEYVLRIDIPVG